MPDVLVFTTAVPKLLGAKILLDMHDPMPELYMSKYHTGENNIGVRILKYLESASFRFSHHIITANESFKSIFLKRNNIYESKINVILNCPDPKIFNPQPTTYNSQLSFTLFYMGTVEERFGLDIVLTAIPHIVKQIPNFRFVVIPKLEDEGVYFQSFRQRITSSNLSSHVIIELPKPLEEIARMLNEVDLGVVLAKNGVFTENIFPVKLLEFIQMNIPVIATKTKFLSQYFTDDQIYFLKKNTPEEFTRAVVDLYHNTKLRKSFSQKAKQYLKKYNWEKEEKKYLEIIDSLTKPRL